MRIVPHGIMASIRRSVHGKPERLVGSRYRSLGSEVTSRLVPELRVYISELVYLRIFPGHPILEITVWWYRLRGLS
jgi:hypothetical protein